MSKYTDKELVDFYKEIKQPPLIIEFIIAIALLVLCGFTIMVLWSWFIIPFGLPAISLAHAIGIDLLITFLVSTTVQTDIYELYWYRIAYSFSITISVLGSGWIVHLFM